MTPLDLETYLHEHIPLSKAVAVSVVRISPESVVLGAPLAPNINHRATVFGGSASALAILAAWALLHTRLTADGHASRLVIQKNTMVYDKPITGDFTARSFITDPDAYPLFVRTMLRKGRARIEVKSLIEQAGQVAGQLEGTFVALKA